MSKSSYVLKIQKDNTVYTCDLYTTQEEARSTVYPTYRLFKVNINGQTLYAPFTSTLDEDRESTPLVCPIFLSEGTDTLYCVAQKSYFRIAITTKENETITVTASNKPIGETGTGSYPFTSGSYWFPYGTTWTASVAGATGWNAGALSPGASGTLTNANVTVTAGAATHKTYVLTLAATTHQTITLYYKNHDGSALATSWTKKTSTSSAQKFTLGHGSKWYATIAGATGWNAGTISGAGSESSPNTLTAAHTVSATAATHKTYTITLTQKANETVTIHYKNHNGTSLATSWSTKTSSVTLGHGSQYYCTISASTGYKAGTITSPGTASSPNTLTAAKTISFTAATAITPVITINFTLTNVSCKVTYTNTSGQSKTETIIGIKTIKYTIKYNTTVKIECPYDASLESAYITIKKGSDTQTTIYEGNSWTSGKHTANTTYSLIGEGINI